MEEQNKNTKQNTNKKLITVIVVAAIAFALLTVATIVAIGFLVYSMNMTKGEVQKKYIEDVYMNDDIHRTVERTINVENSSTDNSDNKQNNSENANSSDIQEIQGEAVSKTYVDWRGELQVVDNVDCGEYSKCYIAGTVVRGDEKFVGHDIYLRLEEMMGSSFTHFLLYQKDGKTYKFIFDKSVAPIAGIDDVPETLVVDDLNIRFQGAEWVNYFFKDVTDRDDHKMMKHDTLGKVYRAQDDCLVAELPNHTAQAYGFEIPFVDDETRKPKITFNDGTKNDDVYAYMKHECISLCTAYIHNDRVTENDLKKIGKTIDGDAIYALKDDNNQVLEDLYNDKNTVAYFGDDWNDKLEHNKYSYEEYIDMHPYLYWKDPFGNFVEFINEKFTVAAEMCKPVVYFYAEEEKNVHFDVSPVGGFTHTEPQHNDGWDIQTIGNGRIKDNKTGKEYDSLLWEGMALNYSVPDSGWVIAQRDLNGFFDEKLNTLGMNEKEINDFKEYWLERLNDNPYYRISFMDRDQFDRLAPLHFSENPDHIIRVMMIAKGEQNYYELPAQNITTDINRDGFTVVEWGGMLER